MTRYAVSALDVGLWRNEHLRKFLGGDVVVDSPLRPARDAVRVGWGRKPSGRRAERLAKRYGVPALRLEDGFIRSVGLGVEGARPLSLIVDDLGIYYDTTRPSRLVEILNGGGDNDPLSDPRLIERARHCMQRIAAAGLSKYNHAPDPRGALGRTGRKQLVLVVDQTAGDLSVSLGQAAAKNFRAMYDAALAENPDAEILVKVHPDVIAGRKRGYLGALDKHPRVTMLVADVNPRALLERVDRVYTVTSQLGLEAVLAGKPVSVFGVPFYSGWGLTDDRARTQHAQRCRTALELFAAAYILYPRYLDPVSGQRCELEAVVEHLALQRHWYAQNRGRIYCVGFRPWKHGFVRKFLASPGNDVRFVRSARHARRRGFAADARLLIWGQRERPDVQALAQEFGVRIERMEDGFLRSIGLGSDFVAPLSLVVDRSGIYYDPRQPSDLEQLLAYAEIADAQRARARALRASIIDHGVSKYNFASSDSLPTRHATAKPVILVPGQVEDDVSVLLGCPGPKTNRELLEAVRQARPNGYILFKPHPEVVSGNRKGLVTARRGDRLWDAIVSDASVAECLDFADEVHTLTSLVGFEALLREVPVFTYGQPFYAGWGLTHDLIPLPRRLSKRRVTLEEMVAAVLILYPRYIDSASSEFTTPEAVVERIHEAASSGVPLLQLRQPRAVRQLRRLWRLIVGVQHVR